MNDDAGKKSEEPQRWPVPDWHTDFGDAQAEIEHLRALAEPLLAVVPGAKVVLETPEPGLMNLAVELPDVTLAEVHSVRAGGNDERKFGLFFAPDTEAEQEIYADNLADALSHFSAWSRSHC